MSFLEVCFINKLVLKVHLKENEKLRQEKSSLPRKSDLLAISQGIHLFS